MPLDGKVALVTGASRGIGKAVALALAGAGADVAVNFRSSARASAEVARTIESMGRRSLPCGADVASADEVRRMVEAVAATLGVVDVLVNNAGITDDGLLTRMSDESWNRVVAVNLTGAFNCTRAVVPGMMRRRWGRIVNVGSVVGLAGNPGQANYAASKAGLIGLTRAVAREYSSRNILVNAVSPGYIHTDMTDGREGLAQVETRIPLGRVGSSEEVASAVLFLAESATYTTGAVIDVSGGLVM